MTNLDPNIEIDEAIDFEEVVVKEKLTTKLARFAKSKVGKSIIGITGLAGAGYITYQLGRGHGHDDVFDAIYVAESDDPYVEALTADSENLEEALDNLDAAEAANSDQE